MSTKTTVSSHSVNRALYVTLCTLAVSASAAFTYLDRAGGAALAPAPASPISAAVTTNSRAVSPARGESIASRIRRTLAWLDAVTTPKGAYFWPDPGIVCGAAIGQTPY